MSDLNRDSNYILPFFLLPEDQDELDEFVNENPQKFLLEKNFFNRGVKIVSAKKVRERKNLVFYQEFMDNPFLIDNHAFDFGIFVLITSFNPLRIYRFDADVLLRFCSEPYHPFDWRKRDKYVVKGESKTVYEMPSFEQIYKTFGFPSKIMFENYIAERGHDVTAFWKRIDDVIVDVIFNVEPKVIENLENLEFSAYNFFELVRFDLIIDAELNPYVLEVNMSPNVSPANEKYEENVLIYEQLVFNVIQMIGAGSSYEFWSR